MAPAYATINTPVQQGVPGYPTYLIGSYDYSQADTRFLINHADLTSNVVTLTGTVTAGKVPVAGQVISVLASNSAYNVGVAGVAPTTVTAVGVNATTGIGTVQYALTHANIPDALVTGRATMLVPEVGETLADMTSNPVSIQANTGPNNGRDIRFEVTMSGSPTATVTVESAMNNINSEYTTEAAAVTTALSFAGTAGTKTYTLVDARARFYRFKLASTSGSGSPTVIAKVLV
jgi:hypothetical protein